MIKVQRIVEYEIEKLDVMEITLLSVEEYQSAKQYIPLIGDWWWLRSPGSDTFYAAFVFSDDGSVSVYGAYVNSSVGVVRPTLRIRNLSSLNLTPGDKIMDFVGHNWTVISDTLILCDNGIGRHCFHYDWKAEDANVYEESDVKKYIENWWEENHE